MKLYTMTIGNTHVLGGAEYIGQLIQEEMHKAQAFDVSIKPIVTDTPEPKTV